MLQKRNTNNKECTKQGLPVTPTKTNVTKEGIPTIKNATKQEIPTIKNVTKEGLPTTTIKKSIVENQTSGKIKTNATKEGLPTTTEHQQNECYKRRNTNNKEQQRYK